MSLTGLHFAYSQAPASMQGTILALWYAATGLGDLLGGVLYTAFESLPQSTLFLICAGLIAGAFFVHLAVSVPYKPRPRLSDEAQSVLDEEGLGRLDLLGSAEAGGVTSAYAGMTGSEPVGTVDHSFDHDMDMARIEAQSPGGISMSGMGPDEHEDRNHR